MQSATKGLSVSDRLACADWCILETGAPALNGAVCAIDCEVASVSEVGTHTLFYCQVKAVRNQPDCDGLIYFGRDFHRSASRRLVAPRPGLSEWAGEPRRQGR